MSYWLMKSEPDVFSLSDLEKAGRTGWNGVRNYQARNFLRAMKKGDRAFFYHSNAKPPAVVGVMEVSAEAHPDPTQFDPKSEYYDPSSPAGDPRWSQVEVRFVEALPRPVPLDELRKEKALRGMVLLNNSRLSVQPVLPAEWDRVLELAGP